MLFRSALLEAARVLKSHPQPATILFAAFTAGITMVALNGLPQLYHPVFNAPRFARASQDGFFLAIEAADPTFDEHAVRQFLSGLGAREVVTVEH